MSERQELEDSMQRLNAQIDAKLLLIKEQKDGLEKLLLVQNLDKKAKAIAINTKFQRLKAELETLTKQLNDIRRSLRSLNTSYTDLEYRHPKESVAITVHTATMAQSRSATAATDMSVSK